MHPKYEFHVFVAMGIGIPEELKAFGLEGWEVKGVLGTQVAGPIVGQPKPGMILLLQRQILTTDAS